MEFCFPVQSRKSCKSCKPSCKWPLSSLRLFSLLGLLFFIFLIFVILIQLSTMSNYPFMAIWLLIRGGEMADMGLSTWYLFSPKFGYEIEMPKGAS